MQTKTIFLSLILLFSFLFAFALSSEQAEASWCWWSNYDSGKFCSDTSPCPSAYSSGSNCYYDFCDCSTGGGHAWHTCFYDNVDSNPTDCPTKTILGKCYSKGSSTCTSSGWSCEYTITPITTEGPPDDPSCKDGIDNDCDGYTDIGDRDCIKEPPRCSDPDDTDAYTWGKCTDNIGTYYDECFDTTSVREMICVDNKCAHTKLNCKATEKCSGGLCVQKECSEIDYLSCPTDRCKLCVGWVCVKKDEACPACDAGVDQRNGEQCECNAECASGICGDKTSEYCTSANPVCQSSRTGVKWAYELSACEFKYFTGSGCSVRGRTLYACGSGAIGKVCGDPDGSV